MRDLRQAHGVKPQPAQSRPPEARAAEDRAAARFASHALFKEAIDYVSHSLRRLGVRTADREDIAQEIAIAAYAKRQAYDSTLGSLRQWLHGFVVNFIRNHRRKQRKIQGPLGELLLDVADRTPGAEDQYMAETQRRFLHDVLFPQVEFDCLMVVIAHDLDDLDFRAIAEEQEISLSTAHERYTQGMAQLRAAYQRHQRTQRARGLVVLPFTLEQLLAADRTIPDAPPELVERLWSRMERARKWRARGEAFRAVLRHAATRSAATFIAGGLAGAGLVAALQPASHPAPVVFVQPTPAESALFVAVGTAAPISPPAVAALPASPVSTASSQSSSEEQRLFDAAHQAFDRGKLDLALAKIAAHERDFPAGQLAREREFLRAQIARRKDAGKTGDQSDL